MKQRYAIGAVVAGVLLAGCSTNGSSINPNVSHANLGADKLQMAVGTANVGFDGTVGLNVVTTFRQPNGLSAVLLDAPTVTGPNGFVVTANAPSMDAGTNHISGSVQVSTMATPPPNTFGFVGGAFKYGIAPYNSDNTGNPYPNGPALYQEPFYSGDPVPIAGGPPAYPFFNNGTFISGFVGYSQGFNAFETPLVTGTYGISVIVPLANNASKTFTTSANLNSLSPLPGVGLPGFAQDGSGGGTLSVTVPADPRIVETMIYAVDTAPGNNSNNAPLYFTVGPLSGTGTLSGPLPDTLGPCSGNNCQNGAGASVTFQNGDPFIVYAITYDYPAFEASPPGSNSESPAITGPDSGGQADISISQVLSGNYGGGGIRPRHIQARRHGST